MGDRINVNDILYPGDGGRWSSSGQYQLVFQEDGNFVLYKKHDDDNLEAIWATATNCDDTTNHSVLLQADGNFVMYDADGQPRWDSGSSSYEGVGSPYVLVQDDGNVCLYDDNVEGCYWSTNTYQG